MSEIDRLKEAILEGDEDQSADAANAAIEAGVDPATLIKEAINEPMDKVGKAFQDGDLFLPELIMIGDAARAASDVIVPHISAEDLDLSLIHISEPTRLKTRSRMPSSA